MLLVVETKPVVGDGMPDFENELEVIEVDLRAERNLRMLRSELLGIAVLCFLVDVDEPRGLMELECCGG
jgi:hypothetical protein